MADTPQDNRTVVGITTILIGVIGLVVGLVLAPTIITQATTSGTTTGIGSFTGAQSINNLLPLIYYAGLATMATLFTSVGILAIRKKI